MTHFFYGGLLNTGISRINTCNKFKNPEWVFYGSPPNSTSLTCGLIAVDATPGEEPGKGRRFGLVCVQHCKVMEISLSCANLCVLVQFNFCRHYIRLRRWYKFSLELVTVEVVIEKIAGKATALS